MLKERAGRGETQNCTSELDSRWESNTMGPRGTKIPRGGQTVTIMENTREINN